MIGCEVQLFINYSNGSVDISTLLQSVCKPFPLLFSNGLPSVFSKHFDVSVRRRNRSRQGESERQTQCREIEICFAFLSLHLSSFISAPYQCHRTPVAAPNSTDFITSEHLAPSERRQASRCPSCRSSPPGEVKPS